MKYELAVFDMDGTILNTLDDLADSTNYALEKSGFPTRSIAEVKSFVGNGILRLIKRAVPPESDDEAIAKVYTDFTEHYKAHCADKTKPYEGIEKLLCALHSAGVKTAVVSNKADFAVQELCLRYFPGLFDAAVGERAGVRKKPSPDSVNEVLNKLGISHDKAVYIGDSDVDVETARNANTDGIFVDWGFRDRSILLKSGASVIVSTPEELLSRIV